MLAHLKLTLLGITSLTIFVTAACRPLVPEDRESQKHTTVGYSYDAGAEAWVQNVKTGDLTLDNDNPAAARNNTLVIQLKADAPIQEIIIDEGFVSGGAEPILEIDGNPGDSDNGTIRIGTLTMDTVDARRLQIRDTQVVTSNLTSVVAQDNELELSYTTVAVVFVERGVSSTLSLSNFRVDRIRILGVGGNVNTHVERITLTRSSFLGIMRIEDANINSLVLKNVSLQED